MLSFLFIVILITFIGVGLPDSVLGAAWPSIYTEFSLPVSLAGYITATVSFGTIISSLLSARLINRFGVGIVTAVSTLLTAISLFGFAFTANPLFFFILALPLGLGAGAIDTGLNSFVALHYSGAKMSFLHCFYGLGVAVSPYIMSLSLGDTGNWRKGYIAIAILQSVITVVSFASLPLWFKSEKKDREESEDTPKTLSLRELLKRRKVRLSCLVFFTSCAIELTVGYWCSTYFVNTKGISADRSAAMTTLYYIGLTSGRLVSALLNERLGRRRILRISLIVLISAVVLFALPLNTVFACVSLFLIGLGIGPIYPNLAHLTPKFFGKEISQSVMGIEQASTYIGILLMPWFFGVLAQVFSTALLPLYLAVLLCFYAVPLILLIRRKK